MSKYYVGEVREITRPSLPEDWERPSLPSRPTPPERPHPEPPEDLGPLPPEPPGIWPPLEGPDFPLFPVPPDIDFEPGEIWPPIRPPGGERPSLPVKPGQGLPKRLFFALVYLQGYGLRWVVVDLNAIHRPELPGGRPPDWGIEGPELPTREELLEKLRELLEGVTIPPDVKDKIRAKIEAVAAKIQEVIAAIKDRIEAGDLPNIKVKIEELKRAIREALAGVEIPPDAREKLRARLEEIIGSIPDRPTKPQPK